MAKTKKPLNNEQAIKMLLKELGSVDIAILRERILQMAALTKQAATEKPQDFTNWFFHANDYIRWSDKVTNILKFEE